MYETVTLVICAIDVSLFVVYLLTELVYYLVGWLTDNIKDGLGVVLARKLGLLGGHNGGELFSLLLIAVFLCVVAVGLTWIISIPLLIFVAIMHGLRGFLRFKTKVNTALEKE